MIYEALNENIDIAAQSLLNGEIIVYPTDTLYGFGVDATNEKAIKKLNQLKKRTQPLSIIVSSYNMLYDLCFVDKNKIDLNKYFPGPYTLLFNKKDKLPNILTVNSKKIGIRMPESDFAIKLVDTINKPIVTTSVNIHNEDSLNDIYKIKNKFPDLNIFSGTVNEGSKGSTIIDCTEDCMTIVRQGDGI